MTALQARLDEVGQCIEILTDHAGDPWGTLCGLRSRETELRDEIDTERRDLEHVAACRTARTKAAEPSSGAASASPS